MGYGYQKRDYEIVDYHLWQMDGIPRPFRGPKPENLSNNQYFTCIGAAQTFGCFSRKPYPQLLSEKIDMPVLNAGVAGAGPSHFLKRTRIIELANQSKFVVVQVMSGRSESNSLFTSVGGRAQLMRKSDGKKLPAEQAYHELLAAENRGTIHGILAETRENYLANMQKLLNAIKVPKILLWFSERLPEYTEEFDDVRKLFGKYPHLLNKAMIDKIKPNADEYIESISSEGLPQPLFSRFTGERAGFRGSANIEKMPKMFNTYYPSPEMHERAFHALADICLRLKNQ